MGWCSEITWDQKKLLIPHFSHFIVNAHGQMLLGILLWAVIPYMSISFSFISILYPFIPSYTLYIPWIPFISLYKMEKYWKTIGRQWIPVNGWSLLSSTLSWSARRRQWQCLLRKSLGDLDWLGISFPLLNTHIHSMSFHIILIHSVSLTFSNYL